MENDFPKVCQLTNMNEYCVQKFSNYDKEWAHLEPEFNQELISEELIFCKVIMCFLRDEIPKIEPQMMMIG